MSRKYKMDDLRWVRLFTASHIPLYLVEQIKGREFEDDAYLKHLDKNVLMQSEQGPILNPLFHLWALVDPDNLVRGFLWFTVDPLEQAIVIQTYSVDSNFWGKGAIERLVKHIKFIQKKSQLKKIYWITNHPKHSAKYGFKPSKNVLMEYNEDISEEEEGG